MKYTNYFAHIIRKYRLPAPTTAIILGSGCANVLRDFDVVFSLPYSKIKGMPTPSVNGHTGAFVFAIKGSETVVFLTGRVHFYEGLSCNALILPYLFIKCLGVEKVICTNAVGAVTPELSVGDMVSIYDHILLSANPLLTMKDFPSKFLAMADCYDPDFRQRIMNSATSANIRLHSGVYGQFSGPSYETAAEVRMAATLGISVVGMSLASECLILRYLDMAVIGISMVSNMATGISDSALCHEDVLESTDSNVAKLAQLISTFVLNEND